MVYQHVHENCKVSPTSGKVVFPNFQSTDSHSIAQTGVDPGQLVLQLRAEHGKHLKRSIVGCPLKCAATDWSNHRLPFGNQT